MRMTWTTLAFCMTTTFAFAGEHDDAPAAVPEIVDVKTEGAFAFPQEQARVLADTDDIRLSVYTDSAHIYVQAILWNDGNDELGESSDGRPIGDHSTLLIDADANGEETAHVDRKYSLNPWPTLPGLRYSILLGSGASTGLQVDSEGSGAIRYIRDTTGKTVRADSFLIPLSALDRETGDVIRIAYWGSSEKPEFLVNSVGFEREGGYWSYHLPHEDYHEVELSAGDLVIMPSVVPDGRQDDVPESTKPEPLASMPSIGDAPPELVAEDWINTDGPLTLDALRGDVVVVEFWATWCSPCVAGIPHLNELHEKDKADGLRIVSFTNQSRSHVEEFMKEKPMHYALGTGSELSRRYGVTSIPYAFVVGRDGVLRWHGHPGSDRFDREIEAALAEE